MKRTPLARGTKRLVARKGLKRAKRLRSVGKRAEREAIEWNIARRFALWLAAGLCERCGKRRPLHVHHVLPRSRGGKHNRENLRALCARCHAAIHDHTAPDWADWIR